MGGAVLLLTQYKTSQPVVSDRLPGTSHQYSMVIQASTGCCNMRSSGKGGNHVNKARAAACEWFNLAIVRSGPGGELVCV